MQPMLYEHIVHATYSCTALQTVSRCALENWREYLFTQSQNNAANSIFLRLRLLFPFHSTATRLVYFNPLTNMVLDDLYKVRGLNITNYGDLVVKMQRPMSFYKYL